VERGLTRHKFWEKHLQDDMSREYLYLIESGKRNPTITKANSLAQALGIPLSQILDEAFGETNAKSKRVTIVNWDEAGDWSKGSSTISEEPEKTILNVFESDYECQALVVETNTMIAPEGNPSFPPGTIIVLARKEASPGDYVIAKTSKGNLFRRLDVDGNSQFLSPINPRYPITEVAEETEITGVVIGSIHPL